MLQVGTKKSVWSLRFSVSCRSVSPLDLRASWGRVFEVGRGALLVTAELWVHGIGAPASLLLTCRTSNVKTRLFTPVSCRSHQLREARAAARAQACRTAAR